MSPAAHPDMMEIKGEMALLNQRVESQLQAINAGMSAFGAELHTLRNLVDQGQALLMEKMAEVGTTSMQLRLLTESIREHNALEKSRQETTDRSLADLRDKESTSRGERRGAAFVLVLLVSLVGYLYTTDRELQRETNIRTTETVSANRTQIITHEERIRALEAALGMRKEPKP